MPVAPHGTTEIVETMFDHARRMEAILRIQDAELERIQAENAALVAENAIIREIIAQAETGQLETDPMRIREALVHAQAILSSLSRPL